MFLSFPKPPKGKFFYLTSTRLLLDSTHHGTEIFEVSCENLTTVSGHLKQLSHIVAFANTKRKYLHTTPAHQVGRASYVIL